MGTKAMTDMEAMALDNSEMPSEGGEFDTRATACTSFANHDTRTSHPNSYVPSIPITTGCVTAKTHDPSNTPLLQAVSESSLSKISRGDGRPSSPSTQRHLDDLSTNIDDTTSNNSSPRKPEETIVMFVLGYMKWLVIVVCVSLAEYFSERHNGTIVTSSASYSTLYGGHESGIEPVDFDHIIKETDSPDIEKRDFLAINYTTDQDDTFSELEDNADILTGAPVTIQNHQKDWNGSFADIDNGSPSSFISSQEVRTHGLMRRPLQEGDIKVFTSPIDDEMEVRPTEFVIIPLKCVDLGLGAVIAKLRIMDTSGFKIILGRPFIDKHDLLEKMVQYRSRARTDAQSRFAFMRAKISKEQARSDEEAKKKLRERAMELEQKGIRAPTSTSYGTRLPPGYCSPLSYNPMPNQQGTPTSSLMRLDQSFVSRHSNLASSSKSTVQTYGPYNSQYNVPASDLRPPQHSREIDRGRQYPAEPQSYTKPERSDSLSTAQVSIFDNQSRRSTNTSLGTDSASLLSRKSSRSSKNEADPNWTGGQ